MEPDRKTQILKTAIKRFARHGLHKTTLDEIARDLRIGKATLYHYFESKDALFFATLEYDSNLILEEIRTIFNHDELSLKEKFTEYFVYKENIFEGYKLIYDLVTMLLSEEGLEREINVLTNLLKGEENILKKALSKTYSNKETKMNPQLPAFFVHASWGILFSGRLNFITNPEKPLPTKDFFLRSFENFLK